MRASRSDGRVSGCRWAAAWAAALGLAWAAAAGGAGAAERPRNPGDRAGRETPRRAPEPGGGRGGDRPPKAPDGIDDGAPDPSRGPMLSMGADGKPVWNFTRYLHGTTEQVRAQLNGELERQVARHKQLDASIKALQAEIAVKKKAAVDEVKSLGGYKKLKAERDAAEEELKKARAGDNAQAKLDASAKYNKLRLALEKMEQEAPAKSIDVKDLQDKAWADEASLKRVKESEAKARQWRDYLVKALRDTLQMQGPLRPGAQGILGTVKVLKVTGESSLSVEFEEPTRVSTGDEKEGVSTVQVMMRKVTIEVTGVDTKGVKEGQALDLDRNFVITGGEGGAHAVRPSFTARAQPNPLDELFGAILVLRDVEVK